MWSWREGAGEKPSVASPSKAGIASFLPKWFPGHRKWEEKPLSLLVPLTLSIGEEIPTDAASGFGPECHRSSCPVAIREERCKPLIPCLHHSLLEWIPDKVTIKRRGSIYLYGQRKSCSAQGHSPWVRRVVYLPRGRAAVGRLQRECCSLVTRQCLIRL